MNARDTNDYGWMRWAALVFVASVTACKQSPEGARKALASRDPLERHKAATTLHAMYAKDPSSLGDHGERYWTERLAEARGTTTDEARKILGGAPFTGGEGGGGSETVNARLDDFWVASLARSTRGDDIVFHTGEPRRHVAWVLVDPPPDFDGTWASYYVHGAVYESIELRRGVRQRVRQFYEGGELWSDAPFVDGKLEGVVVTRTRNGSVEREATWSKSKQVSERTFFPNGRVQTEWTYEDGRIARQRSFLESGTPKSCEVFHNGVPAPCPE
jgi:hypothetical protein